MVAYGANGGHDNVVAGTAGGNILSVRSDLSLADLQLSHSGADLILSFGNDQSITLQAWYADASKQVFNKLQFISQDTGDGQSAQSTPFGGIVDVYDFTGLVSLFNAYQSQHPGTTQWTASASAVTLLSDHSDSTAYGGDLAFYYGLNHYLSGMGLDGAISSLNNTDFGIHLQGVHKAEDLYYLGGNWLL